MSKTPIVTVLMPVFNSAEFLPSAVNSILQQTFTDFEFLIFDDGSTDNSKEIINSYSDPRIKIYSSEENLGYIPHLNKGIDLAQGKYIARMDSDDISLPQRLEKQVIFMDSHPEIGVCGTWYQLMNKSEVIRHPTNDSFMRIKMLEGSVLGHPTVMIRTKILKENKQYYDLNFLPSEDYLFWFQLSHYCQLSNIPEVLLFYRIHEKQISSYQNQKQVQKTQIIRDKQVEYLFKRKFNNAEHYLNCSLFSHDETSITIESCKSQKEWIEKIILANHSQKYYNSRILSLFLFYKLTFKLIKYHPLKVWILFIIKYYSIQDFITILSGIFIFLSLSTSDKLMKRFF